MSRTQQVILGVCGSLLVAYGLWGYASQDQPQLPSISFRAGLVVLAIWLALPQLNARRLSVSSLILILSVVAVAVVASRPRILLLTLAIGILLAILQTFGRRFTSSLMSPSPRDRNL